MKFGVFFGSDRYISVRWIFCYWSRIEFKKSKLFNIRNKNFGTFLLMQILGYVEIFDVQANNN